MGVIVSFASYFWQIFRKEDTSILTGVKTRKLRFNNQGFYFAFMFKKENVLYQIKICDKY